jgi:hypothetical protein
MFNISMIKATNFLLVAQAVDIHKMSAAFFIAQKGFLRFV